MVALQYGVDDLIKPHVLAAFEHTRDHVDWHFRLHPMGWERKDEALQVLGIDETVLVDSSRQPLQNQLPQMDLLLTNMSSIVREAVDIGVNAAVCTKQGAEFFDDLLQNGTVNHVVDEDAICACINNLDLSDATRSVVRNRADLAGKAAIAEVRACYDIVLKQCGIS